MRDPSPLTKKIDKNLISYNKDVKKENFNEGSIRHFSVDIKENKSAIEFREKTLSKIDLFKNSNNVNSEVEKLQMKSKKQNIVNVSKRNPTHTENFLQRQYNTAKNSPDNKENSPENLKIHFQSFNNELDPFDNTNLSKPQVCEVYNTKANTNNPPKRISKVDSLNVSFSNSQQNNNYMTNDNTVTTKSYFTNDILNNPISNNQRFSIKHETRLEPSPVRRVSCKVESNFDDKMLKKLENDPTNQKKLQNP